MERQYGNTGGIVDIFAWTWNFWGGCTDNALKQQQMTVFTVSAKHGCFHCLSEEFEVVLATFYSYNYGANTF